MNLFFSVLESQKKRCASLSITHNYVLNLGIPVCRCNLLTAEESVDIYELTPVHAF